MDKDYFKRSLDNIDINYVDAQSNKAKTAEKKVEPSNEAASHTDIPESNPYEHYIQRKKSEEANLK